MGELGVAADNDVETEADGLRFRCARLSNGSYGRLVSPGSCGERRCMAPAVSRSRAELRR